ncbi:MAG: glycine cleavage system aminomethyltransferase GcvT [Phycisphaerales bacterium]|nr:glycine cleavage system aminomethyltransferase GcvT [Phycisphaerales bacterium]
MTETTSPTSLRKTPLHQHHLDHHAQMVDYAGWEMPIKYDTSIKEEHLHCRSNGSLFDVSHMGRLSVKGKDAAQLLERVCSRRIGTMQEGQCRYSFMCNESGGVLDDVIVMRLESDDFLIVVNGANRDKIIAHMNAVIDDRGFKVKFEDRTEKTAMVAIQGPKVMEFIGSISKEIAELKRFRFITKNMMIMKVLVARTGYTGENGVEIFLPASAVKMAVGLLQKESVSVKSDLDLKPCGLAARDTLRLEAGLPLYGHELGEHISAHAVNMPFAMNLDKTTQADGQTFIGQEALTKEHEAGGPSITLIGLQIDSKRTARQDMPILMGDTNIGKVTSGCMSPTLSKSIAMAYIDKKHSEIGTNLTIDAGKNQLNATVVPLPFYKAPKPS